MVVITVDGPQSELLFVMTGGVDVVVGQQLRQLGLAVVAVAQIPPLVVLRRERVLGVLVNCDVRVPVWSEIGFDNILEIKTGVSLNLSLVWS